MVHSNRRKLALSGWLYKNDEIEFSKPIKLQKYLFFYECFSKIENDETDFYKLEGWENGPAFSSVWGDYSREYYPFIMESQNTYERMSSLVDEARAKTALFITKIFNESEISNFTHQLNIWKKHEDRITVKKEKRVKLSEDDLNDDDLKRLNMLLFAYDENVRMNSEIFTIKDNVFIISKDEYKKLTSDHHSVLHEIVSKHEQALKNPVYLEIDEKGALLID